MEPPSHRTVPHHEWFLSTINFINDIVFGVAAITCLNDILMYLVNLLLNIVAKMFNEINNK